MDRIINVKVKGNHLTKDSNKAGTRGEANVTTLRITFGDDWNSYVKKVLFWDAHGMNCRKYTLIPEWKENSDTNVYLFNIPPSALGIAGNMTFRLDGYKENKRMASASATLEVDDALIEDDIEEITQTDLDNLLAQENNIRTIIETGVNETFGYRNEVLEAQRKAEAARDNAKTSETNAGNSAKDAATAMEAAGSSAATAVSILNGIAEELVKVEKAKEDAVKASESALAYAENFDSLAEAVSRAETSASFAETQADLIYGYKEQAKTAKEAAEKTLNDAEKLSEDIEVAKSDIELAMQSVSTSSYWASVSSASAEEAKNEAVDARDEAVEAQTKSQAIQNNLNNALPKINNAENYATNAATSEANAKTYADNAENAVSQSRYIGANGNWYVWDDSRKTFVDSGETAHAGSTVYVGSNPPSNAQVWIDPNGDGDISKSIREIYDTFKSIKPIRKVKITLLASAWVEEDTEEYSQVVSIKNTTANSQVDLQITKEQLAIFREKDISFWAENKNGIITVSCLGQKPTNDYTVQATITEVVLDE